MVIAQLADRFPKVSAEELISELAPPPRFDAVRFASYTPNLDEPSQARAVDMCEDFAVRVAKGEMASPWWRLFDRADEGESPMGLYIDGGFGVGKTHLLASLWHAVPGPKAYGTFVELTNVVGALGFADAVSRLSRHRFLAIDEFELDDPGDTMLMAGLLKELTSAGVYLAATSNTLPDKLGEGRFAAEDFMREIHSLAARFTAVRVEGPDYRHRGVSLALEPASDEMLTTSAMTHAGSTVDTFDGLISHLAKLHPSRYGRLLDGVGRVHISGVYPVSNQSVALRVVAFVDRLYDRAIPVIASGIPLADLFPADMLAGGYRKKYLRALSRLASLTKEAATAH